MKKNEWQPIETAPKDGTLIDVWKEGEFPRRVTDVSWRKPTEADWWIHGGDQLKNTKKTKKTWFDDLGPVKNLTHWMPPPEAPK